MTELISSVGSSDRGFKYKVIFSRRRSISITVSPDKGVIVKAPYRTPLKIIDGFIEEKSEWIRKALVKFSALTRIDRPEGYSDGDSILMYGKEYKLSLKPDSKYSVRPGNDSTIEATWFRDNDPLIIRGMLETWFSHVAKNKLPAEFTEVLLRHKEFGFRPTGLTVRKMKSRWGSCSSKGRIALSYDLIRLSKECREYVMIHELCHLKHHNHGAGFYNLLTEVLPGWKQTRAEIKRYLR
ncbi:MAG: M48 family metallopeptidase [Bacteroidales bacterium]|nr:M48 family metallopeptidase [Bacteroidales bacterium]